MFLDEAVVEFASGKGGAGAATFHREKHVPRGGPNGADGGRGGDVILVADRGKRTLYDFRLHRRHKAEDGEPARGNKSGRDGKSIEVHVPVGTLVWEIDPEDPEGEPIFLADLASDGMRYVVAKGGRGGFGNLHYVSSVRQVPQFSELGAPAETVTAKLELRLLADVGLIGLPNAGKSTLISRISAAKPKIADYPFTTIEPNLGVVSVADQSFTVADMPGLIEGASEGHGLGHQFLKHVERTKVLVHVVDVFPIDQSDPVSNYEIIENELKAYSESIWNKPRIIALNKIDVLDEQSVNEVRALLEPALVGDPKPQIFPISGVTGSGLDPLLFEVVRVLQKAEERQDIPILTPVMRTEQDDTWQVVKDDGNYRVEGKRVERMVAMTNLNQEEGVRFLHRRLRRMGVIEKLREMGVEEGDTVQVGDVEFTYEDA